MISHKESLLKMMERTLIILKPCAIQRGLIGEIVSRFEKKGLFLVGMKMIWLTDEILVEHYSHLKDEPFFQSLKESMGSCPVIVCCWEGIDAVKVVRKIIGLTSGRESLPGTIRGDYSVSVQENVVHAADSLENAAIELKRFFDDKELFIYDHSLLSSIYGSYELSKS